MHLRLPQRWLVLALIIGVAALWALLGSSVSGQAASHTNSAPPAPGGAGSGPTMGGTVRHVYDVWGFEIYQAVATTDIQAPVTPGGEAGSPAEGPSRIMKSTLQ